MNARQFFDRVAQLRKFQKEYFATRSKESLHQSIALEKEIDAEKSACRLFSPKNKMFNNLIFSAMNDDIDYDALPDIAGADGHDGSIWGWIDMDYGIIPSRLFRASERPIFCEQPHFYDCDTIIVPREKYLTVYRPCFGRYPFFGNPFPPLIKL